MPRTIAAQILAARFPQIAICKQYEQIARIAADIDARPKVPIQRDFTLRFARRLFHFVGGTGDSSVDDVFKKRRTRKSRTSGTPIGMAAAFDLFRAGIHYSNGLGNGIPLDIGG